MSEFVPWWRTEFGESSIEAISTAIRQERIGQGILTENFEKAFAEALGVTHALAVTSGSVALYVSLLAAGVKSGDEVIVPDRTWVATAHAAVMIGARVVLVEVEEQRPIINISEVEKKISSRTRAIIPVHLNGRGCDMNALTRIAAARGIVIIEDACQALFSAHGNGRFMGTSGVAGCFSLGTTKFISSGQGGVIVSNDSAFIERAKLLKNHGVIDNFTDRWNSFGCNFKFTDLQAAMVHQQLEARKHRAEQLRIIADTYEKAFADLPWISYLSHAHAGELPLYVECVTPHRDRLMEFLHEKKIQCRPFTPSLHTSDYLNSGGEFSRSLRFHEQGVYLPGGPYQSASNIEKVVSAIRSFVP